MGRQPDTEEITCTISSTASGAEPEERFAALAARWPQFSATELRRLHFLAYRRANGRLRPPAPLRAAGAGARMCEEIAAYLRAPTLEPQVQDAAAPGVPQLWRAWTAGQEPAHRWHNPQM